MAGFRDTTLAAEAQSDITLQTQTGAIVGTLLLPSIPQPKAVVLIIAGSGPTDRDGNSTALPGKNDAYKLLAAALAGKGVASVRYDKRGIGASASAGTSESRLRFDTYIEDAAAWIGLLHDDKRFPHVIVAGHSEGSLIGMVAVQKAPADAFVSLEGAGRPAAVVLREQLKANLPPEQYALAERIIARLQDGHTMPLPASAPAYMQALFRDSVQPYLISWFKYDPATEIAGVRIPVTIVQGTADVQITMADADALKKADPSARLVIVDGMNHVLKHAPETTSPSEIMKGYDDPSLPVDPQVTEAIVTAPR
ncbi:MAG: alpha/beta hydrolase [Candidatus Eremiobacteraeota bacterium]|nr:alpha/beta hydrolase [Candidatus Eremiobacteraeota bacterium]